MRLLEDIIKVIKVYKIAITTCVFLIFSLIVIAQILDIAYFSSKASGFTSRIIILCVKTSIHVLLVTLYLIFIWRESEKASIILAIM